MTAVNRDNNFDLLRLIAAFMVFAGHMSSLLGYPMPMFLWQSVNQIGVIIFFIIGGYLVTLSWERDGNVLRYFVKRFFRIFPAYAVCILLTAFVVGPLFTELPLEEYYHHPQFSAYFKNLLFRTQYFLPAVFSRNPMPDVLNGSYWCLVVEVVMYILIPVMFFVGEKLKIKKILFLFMAIVSYLFSIVQIQFFPEWRCVIYDLDVAHAVTIVPYYFMGAAIAVCKPKREKFNLSIALTMFFAAHCLVIDYNGLAWAMEVLVFAYVIMTLGFTKPIWDLKNMDISYAFFVWGFLIQQMTIHILYNIVKLPVADFGVFLISLVITVLLSLLTERLVERPCRKLSARICASLQKKSKKKPEGSKS